MARVLIVPGHPEKSGKIAFYMDPDIYAALERLEQTQGIPMNQAVRRGMKQYLNSLTPPIHITKRKSAF
jgi:hypothetical protein